MGHSLRTIFSVAGVTGSHDNNDDYNCNCGMSSDASLSSYSDEACGMFQNTKVLPCVLVTGSHDNNDDKT